MLTRPGRWLVRGTRGWRLFDPASGAWEPWTHVARGESVGPILDDGRMLLSADGRVYFLDVESGERRELRDPAGAAVESRYVHSPDGSTRSDVASNQPSLLVLTGESMKTSRLAWLDPQAGTLTPGPLTHERSLRILWSDGPRAIVLEGTQRIALHDHERNERRVILDAADVR